MSALPPKADIKRTGWNVCFVPKADISKIERGFDLLGTHLKQESVTDSPQSKMFAV
jgi:hypothetical protein